MKNKKTEKEEIKAALLKLIENYVNTSTLIEIAKREGKEDNVYYKILIETRAEVYAVMDAYIDYLLK